MSYDHKLTFQGGGPENFKQTYFQPNIACPTRYSFTFPPRIRHVLECQARYTQIGVNKVGDFSLARSILIRFILYENERRTKNP